LATLRASATAAGDTPTKGPEGVCRLFVDQPARRRLLCNCASIDGDVRGILMAGKHRSTSPSTSGLSPVPIGRHRTPPRHSEASVWLGAGALALGLGAALTTGAGVAQADTGSGPNVSRANDGPQTSIRTVVRATTIRSGAPSSSFESTKESVVSRPASPAVGDNGNEPSLEIAQLVLQSSVPGLIPASSFRSSAVGRGACSRGSPSPVRRPLPTETSAVIGAGRPSVCVPAHYR
jgi:hypothetical protein